ncbi:hypothetical protein IMAU10149_01849 [Lactobacillus helveticus]|nr:hypothetical protein [Lactobacillus helveticus]
MYPSGGDAFFDVFRNVVNRYIIKLIMYILKN